MPEDPCAFDAEAKARGVPVIVDCGVAPGLSNFAVGRAASAMDEVDRVRILVGGLPVVRRRPWEYAAVFSPIDVLEEYTRPVRKVVGGETTTTEPLMEPERIDVEGVGTLEAFDTDGLRSLVRTVPARHMVEKTMRWPGHRDRILLLREAGFLRTDPVEAGGVSVRPIDLTARLLIDDWRLEEGAEELTVLLVTVEGKRGGTPVRRSFRLIDRTDRATGDTSMARTTGFPAAIAARWLLDGTFREAGVHPPEVPGRNPDLWARMLAALADRGVRIEET
jgi:saccharopine dehydrogenase-like NADP-dependent oxidoreductase